MYGAVNNAAPQIAAQLVGAQPVAGLRRQPLGAGKALQRVIRGKQLRGDRHQRGNDRYRQASSRPG